MNSNSHPAGLAALLLFLGFAWSHVAFAGGDLIHSDGFENDINGQIAAARTAPDGPVSLPIHGAVVTYTKPLIGNDVAGFFIQANNPGPALFIAVDPETLPPVPIPGDVVSFTITEMGTRFALRQATMISGFSVTGSGVPIEFFNQDVTMASDLVSALDSYESELISLNGVITAPFTPAGTGFQSASIDTIAIVGNPNLLLRLPTDLRDSEDLEAGCIFSLDLTPLWRFNGQSQPSAWAGADIAATSCPPPRVLAAVALDSTTVSISFSRLVDSGSVMMDGSQFVFDNGLLASAASVTGRDVIVTTSEQVSGQLYSVLVDSSVMDTMGSGVDMSMNQATFPGFTVRAGLKINELNANIAGGCDLVELRVVSGGTMHNFELFERIGSVLTFGALAVEAGDIVVVHFDSTDMNCNPGPSGNETVTKTDFPASGFSQNYDTAWDWYSTDSGITSTDNVLTLYDDTGTILDAVFASDDTTGTAAADTEAQAAVVAAAGEWEQVGGGVPAGGFVDDDFNANAVQDLNGTDTSAFGTSIQRNTNADSNTLDDWTMDTSSWGVLNTGQSR